MKMQQLQFIKQFQVDHAKYQLEDGQGERVELHVNYKHNSFQIKGGEKLTNVQFRQEVLQVAKGLLARKHSANLANREQYL